MKQIMVEYWCFRKYDDLKYKHGAEYKYSRKKRDAIIDDVLSKGYRIMLESRPDTIVIYIDKDRFQ